MEHSEFKIKTGIHFEEARARQLKQKIDQAALDFEKVFARQMVEQMTKEVFNGTDNKYSDPAANIYKSQISETLANELAEQESLGMAKILRENWIEKILNLK